MRRADGLTHLVYELLLVNQSAFVVTVDSVDVLDGASDATLKALASDNLPMVLRLSLFGGKGTTLQPSQSHSSSSMRPSLWARGSRYPCGTGFRRR